MSYTIEQLDCAVKTATKQLRAENERLKNALRYWLPDETMIPAGHEVAWNEHVALIPEHRRSVGDES